MDQTELLKEFDEKMSKNVETQCHLGQGYYPCITPVQIKRYVLDNPKWYTAYTPYQAEISQGRLEMLHNFQVLTERLTGLQNSNCSLLDEANGAIEAMLLAKRFYTRKHKDKDVFLLDVNCFEHIKQSLYSTAVQLDIKIVEVDWNNIDVEMQKSGLTVEQFAEQFGSEMIKKADVGNDDVQESDPKARIFGGLFQNPNSLGLVFDYSNTAKLVQSFNGLAMLGTDFMYW